MHFLKPILLAILLAFPLARAQQPPPSEESHLPAALRKVGPYAVRVGQLVQDQNSFAIYPNALPTLLAELREVSTINVDPEPVVIASFADPLIFDLPLIYVNFGQRADWSLSPTEIANLRKYLERGGFLLIDAGITAEFLRDQLRGQHHSFGEWKASPELEAVVRQIYPTRSFRPLPRSHPVYSLFHKGLPDPSILPDTVRDFVVNEKWPQGTYSMVAMEVNGRIAILATPIIAMGWGKTALGTWETTIGFRIRESAPNLDQRLSTAAYSGDRFEVVREDGAKDIIFCQERGLPAWVFEPNGRYRVFRYYHSREISEFAHVFYTQLGLNIALYALTH